MYQAFSRFSGRFKSHVCGQENRAGDGLGTRLVLPYVAVVKLATRIISFNFVYDSFTRALPLVSFPVLSAFTLIPSTISHLGIRHATRAGTREDSRMWY